MPGTDLGERAARGRSHYVGVLTGTPLRTLHPVYGRGRPGRWGSCSRIGSAVPGPPTRRTTRTTTTLVPTRRDKAHPSRSDAFHESSDGRDPLVGGVGAGVLGCARGHFRGVDEGEHLERLGRHQEVPHGVADRNQDQFRWGQDHGHIRVLIADARRPHQPGIAHPRRANSHLPNHDRRGVLALRQSRHERPDGSVLMSGCRWVIAHA